MTWARERKAFERRLRRRHQRGWRPLSPSHSGAVGALSPPWPRWEGFSSWAAREVAGSLSIAFAAIGIAVLAHGLFSPLGFNPSDDGWVLAGARRILQGDVPHLDIVSTHSLGSYYLHAPEVILGGPYTLLLTRGVAWLQIAAVAWCWTRITVRALDARVSDLHQIGIVVVIFALTAHTYPILVWITFDALFATSAGLLLLLGPGRRRRTLGYLLLGTAALFRQGFLAVALGSVVLAGDVRRVRSWAVALAPSLGYVAFVAARGGAHDLWIQITAHSTGSLVLFGFESFLQSPGLWLGASIGAVASTLVAHPMGGEPRTGHADPPHAIAGRVLIGTVVAALGVGLALGAAAYIGPFSYGAFGFALGLTVERVFSLRTVTPGLRVLSLALLVGWASSLSLGYNSPAPGVGAIAGILLFLTLPTGRSRGVRASMDAAHTTGSLPGPVLAAIVLIVIAGFGIARQTHIYRDRPAAELTRDLGDVLEGARGIRSNPTTEAFFAELERWKRDIAGTGMGYAIVPDVAVNWMHDTQPNPLPVNWVLDAEFPTPELRGRITGALERRRGEIVVILQKYDAASLANDQLVPVGEHLSSIPGYIRNEWTLVSESRFFELYE